MDRPALTPYYADQQATLYHGDCLSTMRQMPTDSFDLVFTSPPYNLGVSSGGGFPKGGGGSWKNPALRDGYADHDDAMPFAEYVAWQNEVLRECWRLIKPTGAIYYQHKPRVQAGTLQTPLALIPDGLPVRQIVIWDRGGGGVNYAPTHYVPTHEWIVVIAGQDFRLKSKGASSCGDLWRALPARGNAHPAPFPQALVDRAIDTTGATSILDPFAGSGTVLRAAKDAGIRGVGIELTARYCDMAVARLGQEVLDFGGVA